MLISTIQLGVGVSLQMVLPIIKLLIMFLHMLGQTVANGIATVAGDIATSKLIGVFTKLVAERMATMASVIAIFEYGC